MQQAKISTFFKPSRLKSLEPPELFSQVLACELSKKTDLNIHVTYKRRDQNPDPQSRDASVDGDTRVQLDNAEINGMDTRMTNPSFRSNSAGKTLNKKRSYAQYHLELGQSDFLLHSCLDCGLMYARGDEEDEKVHRAFHKNYYQGIQFKGWRNERVASTSGSDGDRILLVLDGDPPAQKHKVKQVIKVMEKELGFSEDQLLHKLCKVYLFVSRHRIVGCLVAEPIRRAHLVVPSTSPWDSSDGISRMSVRPKLKVNDKGSRGQNPTIRFGDFNFQREVVKRDYSTNRTKVNHWDSGAILCQEEAVPAICGIRAIWVVPSNRRKRIASKLMDAARNSFCTGQLLEPSHCAFSPPTSSGKAFACSYNNIDSFLVYRAEDI